MGKGGEGEGAGHWNQNSMPDYVKWGKYKNATIYTM